MGAELSLEGLDELLAAIEQKGLKVAKVEGVALKAAAEPVAKDMQSLVPISDIQHPHIREDIQISGVKTAGGIKYVTVGPGKETNWRAKFLELGTSKMAAKPFMGPAYEQNKANITRIIRQTLKEALES